MLVRLCERIIVTDGRIPSPVQTMKDHYDPWFVRLPDGRTIRAKSTTSVRHHVEAGHIPVNSQIRRESNEEWVALVWVAEFADFARAPGATPPPAPSASGTIARSGVASRLDPMRLQTVGIRGLIDELIAALDSTLTRSKLGPAVLATVLVYLGMFAAPAAHQWLFPSGEAAWLPVVAGAGFALLVLSVLNAILAKLTHLELSTMRPARLKEALASVGSYTLPAVIANVVVAGLALGLLFLMRHTLGWADTALRDASLNKTLTDVVWALVLAIVGSLSVLAWLVVGLCWLLTPAIVVEESSWMAGMREWRQLLRDHFGRVLVYEGLTLLLGIGICLPMTLAVGLTFRGVATVVPAWPFAFHDGTSSVAGGVTAMFDGLTAAPLLALLPVANVFIYLNLRYEQTPSR
jgi:hypothetical protein